MTTATSTRRERRPGYVPVERRWLGLDRRSLPPAIVVAIVGILLGGILPLVNDSIDYDNPIAAGDVLNGGLGITMVPPVSWQLESGLRVAEGTGVTGAAPPIVMSGDGVSTTVTLIPTADDPATVLDNFDELSDKLDARSGFTVNGGRQAFTTDSGISGVIESYSGVDVEGQVAVFTFDDKDVALSIVTEAPPGQLASSGSEIQQMLSSIEREATS